MIDDSRIHAFLSSWAEGVIEIGRLFKADGDYQKCAENFLLEHYAFEETEVLFKPTFTKEEVFRNSKQKALSYFVKGQINEDNGFALKPWEAIDLDECNTLIEEGLISVMGTLLFKPLSTNEVTKVAFTFILIEVEESLKIRIHHSSPVV